LTEDLNAFIAIDFRFHAALGRVSGNALLAATWTTCSVRFTVLRSQYVRGAVDFARSIASQRRSLESLIQGDEASILDAVDEHLGRVEEHFLGARLPRWDPRYG
jgi:DNA-binding GntR family transcriptional regulator